MLDLQPQRAASEPAPSPSALASSQYMATMQHSVPSSGNLVYIVGFDDTIKVQRSLQRPRCVTMLGSDGQRYTMMVKATDDLRKDKRLMEFNQIVNVCLRQNTESRRRQLHVRTFSVTPLGDAGGIVQWVPNLIPLRTALNKVMKDVYSIRQLPPPMEDREFFRLMPAASASIEEKLRMLTVTWLFEEQMYARHPPVLCEWQRRAFTEASVWWAARLAYTRTTAVMCMVGFVLGLGDRHGENILLDTTNGDVLHVDFDQLFNRGEQLRVPEIVPFRLTRHVRNGFGPLDVEGAFRRACESTMRVLRHNEHMLLTVMHTFLHDPLVEWKHTRAKTQQPLNPQHVDEQDGTRRAQHRLGLIQLRIQGHMVSLLRQSSGPAMSVDGQVQQLLNTATDDTLLAQMYYGWCPFL